MKLPVAALTATVSTTVQDAAPNSSTTAKPASQPAASSPKPTSPAVSTTTPTSRNQPTSSPSSADSRGDSSEYTSQSSSISPSAADITGLSAYTGSQVSESGNAGIGALSSQGSGVSSGDANGPGTSGSGEAGDSGSVGSSSGSSSSESNHPSHTIPFIITPGGLTIFGTAHDSTAAVVAGTTISAGDLPTSPGRGLISVHPTASSIAIGGESQSLPNPKQASALETQPTPVPIIGSHIMTAFLGASEVSYAGTTLSQDGLHATIENTDVYVGSSGFVIDESSTIALPISPSSGSSLEHGSAAVTITAADHTLTSYPSSI